MASINPPLILCDTDVIIQLFVARSVVPLRCLRDRFGVQPTVVPEVGVELQRRAHSDIARRYASANQNGLIKELDVPTLRAIKHCFPPEIAEDSPDAVWDRIQDLGDDYYRWVDLGESYTYAASMTLRVPTTSNDGRAIKTLRNNGIPVPVPVLRAFDLIAFSVQCGAMPLDDADEIRKKLVAAPREFVPRAFQHCGFAEGLKSFLPRLIDGSTRCEIPIDANALTLMPG